MLVNVTVLQRKNQSVLVEWLDNHQRRQRVYVLSSLIVDGRVPLEELQLGIPFGTGYELLLLGTRFEGKADCIAQALEQAGIDNYNKLQNAPRKVGHICGEDIYQIVSVLNEILKE